jgi:hypothetical protein
MRNALLYMDVAAFVGAIAWLYSRSGGDSFVFAASASIAALVAVIAGFFIYFMFDMFKK